MLTQQEFETFSPKTNNFRSKAREIEYESGGTYKGYVEFIFYGFCEGKMVCS